MGVAALVSAWFAAEAAEGGLVAAAWLSSQPIRGELEARLWPVLQRLWGAAYHLGIDAGTQVAGTPSAHSPDELVEASGRTWITEIVQTRLDRIARILSLGLSRAETEREIGDMLGNEQSAEMIAQTEVTRAVSAGAHQVYRANGIYNVRWQTEDDAKVCPVCMANEAAGPRFYGNPFPSGAIAPPQHPMCRCALLPA